LLFTSAQPLAPEALWALPDLTLTSPGLAWNYDLFQSHGFLVVTASNTDAVPEPTRLVLIITALSCLILSRRRTPLLRP
jgi:hypothetical protein